MCESAPYPALSCSFFSPNVLTMPPGQACVTFFLGTGEDTVPCPRSLQGRASCLSMFPHHAGDPRPRSSDRVTATVSSNSFQTLETKRSGGRCLRSFGHLEFPAGFSLSRACPLPWSSPCRTEEAGPPRCHSDRRCGNRTHGGPLSVSSALYPVNAKVT